MVGNTTHGSRVVLDVGGLNHRDHDVRSGQNIAGKVVIRRKALSIKSVLLFTAKVDSLSKTKTKTKQTKTTQPNNNKKALFSFPLLQTEERTSKASRT